MDSFLSKISIKLCAGIGIGCGHFTSLITSALCRLKLVLKRRLNFYLKSRLKRDESLPIYKKDFLRKEVAVSPSVGTLAS